MPISIQYPQIVQLEGGAQLELTDETWKNRHLVIETNKAEKDVRQIFYKENFTEAGLEFVKDGQLGNGLIKKFGDWQIHVRLFLHGKHIQLDAEAEVTSKYIEHLTHGWISAFKASGVIIEKYFGQLWVYHKGLKKYVVSVIKEATLVLDEPKSKTEVVDMIAAGVVGALLGFLIVLALKK